MWQAKHLVSMGVSAWDVRSLPPEVAAELPAENSIAQIAFKASALYSIVGRYSTDELSRTFDQLLLCDLANKGGVTQEDAQFSADPASNLQLLVLQLTSS
jgi:Tfp pilus assembly ATPase PilU